MNIKRYGQVGGGVVIATLAVTAIVGAVQVNDIRIVTCSPFSGR